VLLLGHRGSSPLQHLRVGWWSMSGPTRTVGGLLLLIAGTFAASKHRGDVVWKPVLSGVALQLVLGVVIMRTSVGFEVFRWLGEQVSGFLDHIEAGSSFVFGDDYETFLFAFKVLPMIIYFGAVISMLYYLGWLQVIFISVARVVQFVMGTSATESFVAVSNIFLGDAPLLVKPFLADLTVAELHALLTCNFATIAGSVMGAYISFGVPAQHLIAASVMSCPAALAVAKLSFPETEQVRVKLENIQSIAESTKGRGDCSIFDAAASGAIGAVALVANVAAALIAFLSIWSLLNSAVAAAGRMVDIDGLSIELVVSYLFWPLAFMMGVPPDDCLRVGRLLGEKTFINEFVAYRRLADFIDEGVLSRRSEVVATYALCGFSNVGSIGVQLGALNALAPERREDVAGCVVRAMINGCVACFMTACVAGMLYKD